MLNKFSIVISSLMILFIISGQLMAIDVNKIIKKVQNTYDDMDYLTASFKQVESFKLTGSQTEVLGKIYVKKGVKYRFESEDQVIVTDGKNVWTYNALSNQLLIDDVRENSGAFLPRDMLFKYPKDHYATLVGEAVEGKQKIYTVRLDPKEDATGFLSSIRLWIQDKSWHILKIESKDLGGNISAFEINDMDIKTKLNDDLFQYTAPDGVDVVDMRKSTDGE